MLVVRGPTPLRTSTCGTHIGNLSFCNKENIVGETIFIHNSYTHQGQLAVQWSLHNVTNPTSMYSNTIIANYKP